MRNARALDDDTNLDRTQSDITSRDGTVASETNDYMAYADESVNETNSPPRIHREITDKAVSFDVEEEQQRVLD